MVIRGVDCGRCGDWVSSSRSASESALVRALVHVLAEAARQVGFSLRGAHRRLAELRARMAVTTNARAADWQQVDAELHGRTVRRLVLVRDVLWYTVNKRDLLRLVIVRDPDGIESDDFFITTDRTATGAQVASRYAGRWSIEVCFRDVKQDLGAQDPQTWKRQGPERAASLSLWLHALTWCWYLDTHPTGGTWTTRPWYRHKTTPSFLDALAALRRQLWAQRITDMSSPGHDNTKITEALLDTLAYAA